MYEPRAINSLLQPIGLWTEPPLSHPVGRRFPCSVTYVLKYVSLLQSAWMPRRLSASTRKKKNRGQQKTLGPDAKKGKKHKTAPRVCKNKGAHLARYPQAEMAELYDTTSGSIPYDGISWRKTKQKQDARQKVTRGKGADGVEVRRGCRVRVTWQHMFARASELGGHRRNKRTAKQPLRGRLFYL